MRESDKSLPLLGNGKTKASKEADKVKQFLSINGLVIPALAMNNPRSHLPSPLAQKRENSPREMQHQNSGGSNQYF